MAGHLYLSPHGTRSSDELDRHILVGTQGTVRPTCRCVEVALFVASTHCAGWPGSPLSSTHVAAEIGIIQGTMQCRQSAFRRRDNNRWPNDGMKERSEPPTASQPYGSRRMYYVSVLRVVFASTQNKRWDPQISNPRSWLLPCGLADSAASDTTVPQTVTNAASLLPREQLVPPGSR